MPLPSTNKAAYSLKPRGDITSSAKQGYQWPHKTYLCPPKIVFWKNYLYLGETRVPGHRQRGTATLSGNHPETLELHRLPGYSDLMTPFSTRKLTKLEQMQLLGNAFCCSWILLSEKKLETLVIFCSRHSGRSRISLKASTLWNEWKNIRFSIFFAKTMKWRKSGCGWRGFGGGWGKSCWMTVSSPR